ncbi:filamin A-interacting protein 1-like isoform X1 [Seriola lalandi dorsalis]|uniref:Filamin A interacting protein 1 like n=2 Tax=Seriola lalandi dorsalis TaxID=1841481 RepID=A0A3B4X810_SERLL|nr:filamin A-interacting protein 1-like isoform X1 [Seriola lalandi dorsalis]XP_023276070.1 filamin A-interacting protein 1-like isoform X1 [Seriola lalandi dorsalis]XP_056226916.1 filamin A-interacting protein 1-like isoform X1 [Seriola aureovittata]XP_056226917.1 filamin A-interacting protein 1-like isoform X1 [Seriola aureovittata]
MRSRSNSLEDITKAKPVQQQADTRKRSAEREEPSGRAERRSRHREPPDDTGTIQRNNKTAKNGTGASGSGSASGATKGGRREKGRDLSRDDLVFLLSLLEGELQARDEVITVLRAEKIDLALLEAKYGFVTPQKVLQALQRDTIQGKSDDLQEDIYEKPMVELDKLVEKQRETHRRMLEQLLMVEQSHKQALYKLEDEKRNHGEFMKKSDEFTNLLEQERERLKLLIDQEKVYQERKDEENNKKVISLKEELTKLKSFALMVVDEQQRLTEQLNQQTAKVQELSASASQAQEELCSANARLQEEEQKVFRLESELRDQACRYHQEQETMTAKLTSEDAQSRQLRQKLSTLSRQLDELEETNKTLRRAEEELQELRDKISRGECGNSSLMSELEELRKRVLEMEGKDEELIRMEDHCRDLNKKLEKEANQSRGLKAEVDKLNHRIMDLEKLEDAFSKSKQECSSLKSNLEKERTVSKVLTSELEVLKVRVKELEAAETQLGKTELTLKEDLTKLKTLTVMLVDERKAMAEKLKQMENKVQNSTGKLQAEQDKVTSVTEKLIEESKKALRSKAELEEKMCSATKERDDLKAKLRAEEEKSNDLESKINMMKKRLQSLENIEREHLRNKAKEEHIKTPIANRFQQEDNKVKDLTQEVERLRRKLKDMKVVEGDLLKTEEFESLEKRFTNEQEKAKALMEELEISRKELSKYQLAEKKECNQEHVLYKRLKEEEAKSSHLTREVAALKEKIHEYMGTEESICRMKTDHSTLQRKLTQQEVRNKELAREMETLTRELERYRRFSKSLRPGMNGRRFSDLHVSTKEVQTDPLDLMSPNCKAVAPLERAVVNGKLYDESEPEENANYSNELQLTKCSPSLINNVNNLNNNMRRARVPFLKNKDTPHQVNGKMQPRQNGNHVQPGDVVLTHSPGQPLHIKVTPDHGHNTATLEITSPTAENTQSFTSTAVIPTSGGPPKQRITIIQNASISPTAKSISPTTKSKGSPISDEPCSPDRALSPFTMATYSRAMTPDSCGSVTPDRAMSPIQIVSVTTGTPDRSLSTEPVEVVGGHAVFRVTPERQSNWQVQRSNSSGPNVITTEDNKIHIHLGSPFIQSISTPSQTLSPCHTPGLQEQRTQVLANCSTPTAKGNSKITSSIMIKPTSTPIQRPSQITIPLEAFRRPGPTRIPKPKSYSSQKGTNSTAANPGQQNKGQPPQTHVPTGKEQHTHMPAAHNNNPNLANRRL